jgi:hypothetical protein
MMRKCLFTATLLSLTLCCRAQSAVYFIDYATGDDTRTGTQAQHLSAGLPDTPWATAPGHPTKSSVTRGAYSHDPGDIFVYKDGGVWPYTSLPLTIAYSGTAGNIDTYQSATRYGMSWGSGYPVFDGDGTTRLLDSSSKDYIHVAGVRFQNATNEPNPVLLLYGYSNKVSYCQIVTGSVNGLSFGGSTLSKSVGLWEASHNYFYQNFNDLIIAAGDPGFAPLDGSVVDGIKINDNEFAGRPSVMANPSGTHPDGIQYEGRADTFQFLNVEMKRNWFHGNWYLGHTAMMWFSAIDGGVAENNVFSFDNTTSESDPIFNSNANLYFAGAKNIKVYSNTSSSSAEPGMVQANMQLVGSHHLDVVGNIFSKANFNVALADDFWVANQQYQLTDEGGRSFVYPNNAVSPNPPSFNNFIYEITGSTLSSSDFKSGATEPAFDPDYNLASMDNNLKWRPWYPGSYPRWQANHPYDYYDKVCIAADPTCSRGSYSLWHKYVTSGASQPTWPTTDQATVSDGQIVWTAQKVFLSNDYNVYEPGGRGIAIGVNTQLWATDLSTWQAAPYNMETHSMQTDPKFVHIPTSVNDPGNWQLQSSSPAKDALPTASAPTSLFTTDILGVSRPQGPAWDVGAYEYVSPSNTSLSTGAAPKLSSGAGVKLQ